MNNFKEVIYIGFSELIISYFLTLKIVPIVKSFGLKFKLLDYPNNRKNHLIPLVRVGGLAIFFSLFFISTFNLIFLGSSFEIGIFSKLIFFGSCFFLLGLFDDIYDFSPFLRLFIQFIISILLWANEIKLDVSDFSSFGFSHNSIITSEWIVILIMFFWVSGVVNAINWIDGLDGLASGVTLISSFGFLIISLIRGQFELSIISFILIGICFAFLRYNKNPASILMGDCGSNLLGFMLAFMGFLSCQNNYDSNIQIGTENNYILSNIYYSIIILLVPLLDMVKVILKRIFLRKSPFFPDRNHFHHYLLDSGFNQNDSVYLIYLISQWCVSVALLLTEFPFRVFIFLLSTSILILEFKKLLRRKIKKKN